LNICRCILYEMIEGDRKAIEFLSMYYQHEIYLELFDFPKIDLYLE
jgi:hypothetical protein